MTSTYHEETRSGREQRVDFVMTPALLWVRSYDSSWPLLYPLSGTMTFAQYFCKLPPDWQNDMCFTTDFVKFDPSLWQLRCDNIHSLSLKFRVTICKASVPFKSLKGLWGLWGSRWGCRLAIIRVERSLVRYRTCRCVVSLRRGPVLLS